MEQTSIEVAANSCNVTQNTLSERSMNDIALVRSVNIVLRERLRPLDFGAAKNSISLIMAILCDDDVIRESYQTYRKQELKNLIADCRKMLERK